jgi:hypothetical protein
MSTRFQTLLAEYERLCHREAATSKPSVQKRTRCRVVAKRKEIDAYPEKEMTDEDRRGRRLVR